VNVTAKTMRKPYHSASDKVIAEKASDLIRGRATDSERSEVA
jgi:hypothetical protein